MGRASNGLMALVPVGVAALLIAFCLAGAQLYASSAGSAALDDQLDETCRSSSALTLPIPGDATRVEARVAELGSMVPFVEPPRRWAMAFPLLVSESARPRPLTLLWIDGVDANVSPALRPLGDGEIALSAGNLAQLGTEIGGTVAIEGGKLRVTQQFDDVPFAPLPSFWCGIPDLLTPPPSGDRPPPYAIASLDTIRAFGAEESLEYRVVDEPLTLTDARALEEGYATATSGWSSSFPPDPSAFATDEPVRNELERVVARARSVRLSVERNLAPVTLTGIVAGTIVLIAAGVLVARDRQRELRLLALRGLPPWRIAAFASPPLAGAIAIGGAAGFGIAWTVVSGFGPSPNLEGGALRRSIVLVAAALVVATGVVAGVVGVVGDGFADVRRRRVHHRWGAAAIVACVVALAIFAFRSLDCNGGVRTFGVESRGGDLLAMGFPLFALLAVTAVAALVVAVVAPRLRLSGGGLRRTLRLGWRRVVMDAGPLVAVVVSVALAAGCFTVAAALAAGSERQLEEKADVYVGADLAVDVFDPVDIPPAWEPRTTSISKLSAKWEDIRGDDVRGDVIGIDRSRFASVATLRNDASSQSLDDLVEAITPFSSVPMLAAIGVGTDAALGDVLAVEMPGNSVPVQVQIVSTADFFPGKSSRIPMLVIDRDALDAVAPYSRTALLVRDPPTDAVEVLHDSGVRTGVILDATTAFEGSAYSALRWAYAPLATLGVLFAIVALALQLLVVSARRRHRRVADLVMRRTGFTTRGLWWASVVETGVPLVVGCAVGIGAAVLAARLSIVRLDPMPTLAPAARFLVPWDVLLVTACVIPLWTAAIASVIVRSTVSGDPMRVFQGSA